LILKIYTRPKPGVKSKLQKHQESREQNAESHVSGFILNEKKAVDGWNTVKNRT
jgi:hypothetical protein